MSTGGGGGGGVLSWMDDDDDRPTANVSSVCDDVNRDQQYGRGSTAMGSPLASYVANNVRGYTSTQRAQ